MEIKERTDSEKALWALAGGMLVAVLSVFVYAMHAGGMEGFLSMVSVGVLLAGASALVGGALGFLFGIPRTLQQEGPGPSPERIPADAEEGHTERHIDYRVNTNLEQISDWLTKILVGVGLTQIGELRNGLAALTALAAQGFGPKAQGQVFAFALLSYTAVLGFLFGYLWTRLFLAGALRLADQAAIGALAAEVDKVTERAQTTERELAEFKKQSELDAKALNLAYRQINPSEDLPESTQEDLDTAIAAASRSVKVQIFNQAKQVRRDNWRENKSRMERTIPLFRALIRSDLENQYHRNHGQLGFALKDKTDPEWSEAEKELTTAIKIRDKRQHHGWLFYEFNRAISRIMTDSAFLGERESDPGRRDEILTDLRAAVHAPRIEVIIAELPVIQKWMSLNDIRGDDLCPVD